MRAHLRAAAALGLFLPGTLACFLVASHLAVRFIGHQTPDQIHGALWLGQFAGLGWPCAVAIGLWKPSLRAFGLEWRKPDVLPFAALLAVGTWPLLLALDSVRARVMRDSDTQALFEQLVVPGWGGYGVVLAVLAGMPAVMEELTFRGVLQPLLTEAWGAGIGIVLTALAFAGFHLNKEQLVVPFLLGLLLGWLRWRTGSLWPCFLVHAAHNAVTVWAMAALPGWVGLEPRMPPLSWVVGGGMVVMLSAWRLIRLTRPGPTLPSSGSGG